MIYKAPTLAGIDTAINKLQLAIDKKISWKDVDIFGRVYRNSSKNGKIAPEAYINGEYKDVLTNDKKTASIFFIDSEKEDTKEGIRFVNSTKIVFMVDLKKAYPDYTHRCDMEARLEAIELIKGVSRFEITGIEKGIEEVFKGFDVENIKLNDLNPFHVFAIVGDLTYNASSCFN
ncbi:MAG: hypothetical protein BM557_02150 [Flavobacterium sp. MedPE-SWcel]|uniref:hypothetical protein n=1 Tax=uncultured Flavobacterium sp. TaxID=165435 RepID=UPI000916CE8A|nr:hypothetical protein [uncultured Flavobacterium sp.]OIQ22200.1 MAG: hypothetical protein BM557_02150 [Flavobacterium sp. MedPE-SWcel]